MTKLRLSAKAWCSASGVVSAARSQEALIAEGFPLTQQLHAKCLVVHVSGSSETGADRQCLHFLAQQAEGSKAEFLGLTGDDVADTLLEAARIHNVTNLILGWGNRR
jgi:K+-sensing histidine kinase KdpD